MLRFCPVASGSSGNCIYVGGGEANFLVDAGISGKRIEEGLSALAGSVPRIDALFITHEHTDHISGAGVMARRYKIPVYATPLTWRYLLRHKTIGPLDESLAKVIAPGETVSIGGISVTAFEIPHDASQPVGYTFAAGGRKAAIATDIGHITDTVRAHLIDAHILLLESNHDLEMLRNGRYPKVLKDRILGARGHLSNAAAGMLLSEVAGENLRHVFLGHLSEENNRPMIALDTVRRVLDGNNISLRRLVVADRFGVSEMAEA
jgi:phosphoribosyl 1,2-cyclic phosphodiesterase